MMSSLFSRLTPEVIVEAVKANPILVMSCLQKFETFQLFGAALSQEQQLLVSKNLHCVNSFLISEGGKEYVSILIDAFGDFVKGLPLKQ